MQLTVADMIYIKKIKMKKLKMLREKEFLKELKMLENLNASNTVVYLAAVTADNREEKQSRSLYKYNSCVVVSILCTVHYSLFKLCSLHYACKV